MAPSAGVPLDADEAQVAIEEQERRWPVLYSVVFVVASSALLWTLIIGGIGWLIG